MKKSLSLKDFRFLEANYKAKGTVFSTNLRILFSGSNLGLSVQLSYAGNNHPKIFSSVIVSLVSI